MVSNAWLRRGCPDGQDEHERPTTRHHPSGIAAINMSRLPRVPELVLPVGIIGCLLVVLMPLPSEVLDMMLIGNIALAVVILLTTIHVSAPLEFNVFPTITANDGSDQSRLKTGM